MLQFVPTSSKSDWHIILKQNSALSAVTSCPTMHTLYYSYRKHAFTTNYLDTSIWEIRNCYEEEMRLGGCGYFSSILNKSIINIFKCSCLIIYIILLNTGKHSLHYRKYVYFFQFNFLFNDRIYNQIKMCSGH